MKKYLFSSMLCSGIFLISIFTFWPQENIQKSEKFLFSASVVSAQGVFQKKQILSAGKVSTSPIIKGEYFYFVSDLGYLYKINFRTGQKIWQYPSRFKSGLGKTTAPPILAGNFIYIATEEGIYKVNRDVTPGTKDKDPIPNTKNKHIRALCEFGGKIFFGGKKGLYYFESNSTDYPIEVKNNENQKKIKVTSNFFVKAGFLYFGGSKGLYQVNTSSSAVLIFKTFEKKAVRNMKVKTNPVKSTPLVEGNTAYFGCDNGNFYAVDINGKNKEWNIYIGSPVKSSPVRHGDKLYFGADDGRFYCIEPEDKKDKKDYKIAWRFPKEATKEDPLGYKITSSPAILNGAIYFGGEDYYFYSLDLKGNLRWKIMTGGKVRSSPALAEGVFSNLAWHEKGTFYFPKRRIKPTSKKKKKKKNQFLQTYIVVGCDDGNIYIVNEK